MLTHRLSNNLIALNSKVIIGVDNDSNNKCCLFFSLNKNFKKLEGGTQMERL